MIRIGRKTGLRLSVAFLVMALQLIALSPAIRVLLPEPVTCGMECCLDAGECCCPTRLSDSHDEHHEQDPAPSLRLAEHTPQCPANCAAPPSASSSVLAKALRPRAYILTATSLPPPLFRQRMQFLSDFFLDLSSPRGPPVLLVDFNPINA
jgi:hypothetical protein